MDDHFHCDACVEAEIVQSAIAALISHAEFRATLTAAALQIMDAVPPISAQATRSMALPAGFLWELSAVVQIGYWERNGISAHVAAGLPSYGEALMKLAERAECGLSEFNAVAASTLAKQVTLFWWRTFAWEGRSIMGADILLDSLNEELFLDLFAEFLWANRTQVNTSIVVEGGE